MVSEARQIKVSNQVGRGEQTKPRLSQSEQSELVKNRGSTNKVLNDHLGNFPIPPSSSSSSSLSPDFEEDLSLINNAGIPNPDTIIDIRTNGTTKESHYPKYYRKDSMSGNTIGTTELSFVEDSPDKPCVAWSDQNVSQHPKYYNSTDTVPSASTLTNPGQFYDQNNHYVDITGPRTDANVDDLCYTDKDGDKICLQNDKLQNVAPAVVNDVSNCGFLNNIGLLEYSNRVNEGDEKVANGGFLYDKVQGSYNRTAYSTPLGPQSLSCSL
jgi:hypothetical protein